MFKMKSVFGAAAVAMTVALVSLPAKAKDIVDTAVGAGQFNIRRLEIRDKHGLSRVAFNAKVNIYREAAQPILLGIQDKKLPLGAPA